ncbi:hypothetical protein QYE76_020570 [Lolium multiflorum]|uniref:Homeobox domain-containing protein n=1 Tax=Lolium multiflorum TaxID=4521 RepID=A0AAD8R527_LOLMU|nr:putative homeobox-leucine zipper protein HOX26 [Lolium rigidum]KAK1615053.1 hypothetical protein QYE76_020570 [Lolium multiflorum]
MEESLDVEEFVDTRLSLSLVIGAGSRPAPPVQALLPASPPPGNEATAAARKRKGSESGRDGSTATAGQHGKKARRVLGGSCVDDDGGFAADSGARKKLQLTADQAAVMEKSFRAHNVLSHGEKHDLARELGLKPRQVEVWFQNRRARTKLKQTELDCELLRRWCERLGDENERLRRELAELRSSSSSSAFLSRLTAAVRVNEACPSCNKLAATGSGCRPNSRD